MSGNTRRVLLAIGLLALMVIIYRAGRVDEPSAPAAARQQPPTGGASVAPSEQPHRAQADGSSQSGVATAPAPDPVPPRAPGTQGLIVSGAPAPASTAEQPPSESADREPRIFDATRDVEQVRTMVRDFRGALGENPVGTNAEITRALLGDNLKQVRIELPAGSQVNAEGELVDGWGTPFFFHQLSATEMEVRSAGPDLKMWTNDDALTK